MLKNQFEQVDFVISLCLEWCFACLCFALGNLELNFSHSFEWNKTQFGINWLNAGVLSS